MGRPLTRGLARSCLGKGLAVPPWGSRVPALVAGCREPPTGSCRNCFLGGAVLGGALDSTSPETRALPSGPSRWGAVHYRIQKVAEGVKSL